MYIGEIRMFACAFPPKGWAACNGQLLNIRQNAPLFSLLGTIYGGDGIQTFGLPNLQGRATLAQGLSVSQRPYQLGETGGAKTVTLQQNQMPKHRHGAICNDTKAVASPESNIWGNPAVTRQQISFYAIDLYGGKALSINAIEHRGESTPHNNLMPYRVVQYCIAIQGVFPPHS